MCFSKKFEEDALLKYYEAQVVRADRQSFAVHDYCLYVQRQSIFPISNHQQKTSRYIGTGLYCCCSGSC